MKIFRFAQVYQDWESGESFQTKVSRALQEAEVEGWELSREHFVVSEQQDFMVYHGFLVFEKEKPGESPGKEVTVTGSIVDRWCPQCEWVWNAAEAAGQGLPGNICPKCGEVGIAWP